MGSGGEKHERQGWNWQGYEVTTLDVDPGTHPDIVANMTDMGEIGPFDAVYCCHALEHLYPHEVNKALREFFRVVKPGGSAIILVPDLEGVEATEKPLKMSYSEHGMTGLHLIYGDAALIEEFPFMAHHSGFVESTLKRVLETAGFEAQTKRCPDYNLLGIGVRK